MKPKEQDQEDSLISINNKKLSNSYKIIITEKLIHIKMLIVSQGFLLLKYFMINPNLIKLDMEFISNLKDNLF